MDSPIHYKVSICFQKSKDNLTGKEEVENCVQEFFDDNPLNARSKAISFFECYIESLLKSKEVEYSDIRSAYKILIDLFNPRTGSYWSNVDSYISDSSGKHAAVFMIADKPINDDGPGEEINILSLSNLTCGSNETIDLLINLGRELEYFNRYNLDKGKLEQSVNAYDGDDDDLQNFTILKIPISWEGMDLRPDKIQDSSEFLIELINGGESEIVEFKPSLIYNFNYNSYSRPFNQKIPQTICAFLNSKNVGTLFIGVKDNKEIQGLEYDYSLADKPDHKDYLHLQFDKMISAHFEPFVMNNLSYGIRKLKGKDVFIINARSSNFPVFVSTKIDEKIDYKFFHRCAASSREISDKKELINFCLTRFTNT